MNEDQKAALTEEERGWLKLLRERPLRPVEQAFRDTLTALADARLEVARLTAQLEQALTHRY